MLMLETLSTNRNLENTVKEVENMLRDMNVEKGMVYRRGLANGEARGEAKWKLEGKLESAKVMIQDFNLSIKEVSEKLNIPISSLEHFNK